MSLATSELSEAVLAMRREFDQSFARAPSAQTEKPENYLGIRFGDDAYAIRTSDIGGLHVDCRVISLPTTISSFLGVAGFRGLIAPVYDLSTLLGYARSSSPRWLVLVRLGEPIALAFDVFESHFSADSRNIVKATQIDTPSAKNASPHVFDAVRTDTATRPIIHMPSLIETIQRTVASSDKGAINHE